MKPLLPTLLVGGLLSLTPAAAGQVSAGDAPEFTFGQDVINGMGVTSLADLAGKPLLVDFWGTR